MSRLVFKELCEIGQLTRIARGRAILEEGEEMNALSVVFSGMLEVRRKNRRTGEQVCVHVSVLGYRVLVNVCANFIMLLFLHHNRHRAHSSLYFSHASLTHSFLLFRCPSRLILSPRCS